MEQPITDIDIDEYQAQFTDADAYTLVDVREVDEFEQGRLPGSINIPLSEFQLRVDEIDMDKPVVLVCARGNRSARAGDFMIGQGYENLYNLVDGTMGWMMRGLPLETD